MAALKIHRELSASPEVVSLPTPGKTSLSFSASGSGTVEVIYSIARDKSARFVDNKRAVRRLVFSDVLSANPKKIERSVQFCRRFQQKAEEIFYITVIVNKKNKQGDIIESKRSACLCAYYAEQGGGVCP